MKNKTPTDQSGQSKVMVPRIKRIISEMEELINLNDKEVAHIKADALLIQAATSAELHDNPTGLREVIKVYRLIDKWYV